MAPRASSRGTPMATSTWDGSTAPVEQADPLDAATPARSRCISSASLSAPATADVEHVRRALRSLAVHDQVGHRRAQPRGRARPAAPRDARASSACSAAASASGAAQGHRAGDVLGAGPDAVLLAAAVDDRLDRLAVADDQRADALGRADLVAGDGEQGAGELAQRDGHLAERLDRVGVEDHAGVAAALARSPRPAARRPTSLFTHMTETTAGRSAQRRVERLEVDVAPLVHREHDLAPAEVADGVRRRQHRLVLDGAHHRAHGAAAVPGGERRADDAEVVRLGAAGGEDHLVGLGARWPAATSRRACSMPARAARPNRWALDGFPNAWSVR